MGIEPSWSAWKSPDFRNVFKNSSDISQLAAFDRLGRPCSRLLSRTAADLRTAQRFNPIQLSESKSQFRNVRAPLSASQKKSG
jgi:hypothetical protein